MDLRRIDHGACDSTNERALEALAAGTARHGDVHTALEQTRGRGQRGRAWWSAPTGGLYLTLVWAPDAPLDPALLTMAAGLGALDCARSAGATTARLDWPNDVLVDEAKLAGFSWRLAASAASRQAAQSASGSTWPRPGSQFPPAERLVTSLALSATGHALDLAEPLSSPGSAPRGSAPAAGGGRAFSRPRPAGTESGGRAERAAPRGGPPWARRGGRSTARPRDGEGGAAPRRSSRPGSPPRAPGAPRIAVVRRWGRAMISGLPRVP